MPPKAGATGVPKSGGDKPAAAKKASSTPAKKPAAAIPKSGDPLLPKGQWSKFGVVAMKEAIGTSGERFGLITNNVLKSGRETLVKEQR
jgi:hypothetical protein